VSLPAPSEPADQPAPRRGLLLLADVFVAPKRAFATVAATHEWLPAFVLVALAQIAAEWLLAPAVVHVQNVMAPAGPKATLAGTFAVNAVTQTLIWLMMWIWTAVILAAVSGSGPRAFRMYFALAANTGLPAALGSLLFALVVHAHDPASFTNFAQLNRVVPDSLALLEPRDNDRAVAFLASFDLFTLWSMLLVAYGLRYLGKVRLVPALITAFTLWLASALLSTVVPS